MTRAFALMLLLFLAVSNAWARPAARVTATAVAKVVEDLTITGVEPLNFGFITPSAQGGTVTVSPDNKRSETGGVHASSAFTPALFAVHGAPGHSYTLHAPSSVIFSVQQGGKSKHPIHALTVTNFVTFSATAGTMGEGGKLASNGEDKITLGATLFVPPGTAPGVYSGWVPLTVSY